MRQRFFGLSIVAVALVLMLLGFGKGGDRLFGQPQTESIPQATGEGVLRETLESASEGSSFVSPTPSREAVEPNPTETASRPLRPRPKVVVIDPGHGGQEVGAAFSNGSLVLREKDLNLKIGLYLAGLLRDRAFKVVVTRDSDWEVNYPPLDITGDGRTNISDDLQARVDIANETGADIFVSLHNNGSGSQEQSGTEIWYSEGRPFSDHSRRLAQAVLGNLVDYFRSIGHPVVNRGLKDSTYFRFFGGQPRNLFVLGPATSPRHPRATEMPGILVEALFVSNPREAALLSRGEVQEGIAQAIANGILNYFSQETP